MNRTVAVVTGVGNVGFLSTFLNTIGRDVTGAHIPLYYMEDCTSGCDFGGIEWLFDKRLSGILKHEGRGGCNALWNQAVAWAYDKGFDNCIVMNDDIMVGNRGLLTQLVQVLDQNDHIAMSGTGSDGQWEQERKHKERWFTDPSLLREYADHSLTFRDNPVKYTHHVAGPCWACKTKLWLDAGGIPEFHFWAFGEVIPCIELRRTGYQSVAVQSPVTIGHYGGGAFFDIHSDRARHKSFEDRSARFGDEGKRFAEKYGTGHIHLLAQEFDEKLPNMDLPPIKYEPCA